MKGEEKEREARGKGDGTGDGAVGWCGEQPGGGAGGEIGRAPSRQIRQVHSWELRWRRSNRALRLLAGPAGSDRLFGWLGGDKGVVTSKKPGGSEACTK